MRTGREECGLDHGLLEADRTLICPLSLDQVNFQLSVEADFAIEDVCTQALYARFWQLVEVFDFCSGEVPREFARGSYSLVSNRNIRRKA